MDVSLFASSVRPQLYPAFFKSLEGTSVNYEVVFAGNATNKEYFDIDWIVQNLERLPIKYIQTKNIKPAQCYEIARRKCVGETVVWVADDAEFPNDVIGKAYKYWKSKNNDKLILSIQTKESGYNLPVGQLFDMNMHRFFGYQINTPLMAPLALMSRKFLDDLGGFDRRYICGQYENDVVMRAYQQGGTVEIFGNSTYFIDIDHLKKSIDIGESKVEADFINRPFALGYPNDRSVLQHSWAQKNLFKINNNGEIKYVKCVADTSLLLRYDEFEPYSSDLSFEKSESNNLERWC